MPETASTEKLDRSPWPRRALVCVLLIVIAALVRFSYLEGKVAIRNWRLYEMERAKIEARKIPDRVMAEAETQGDATTWMGHPVFMKMDLESSVSAVPSGAGDDSMSPGNWPCFLGPNHNGVSDETGLISSWPAIGPPLLWEREAGVGYSAPSVANGVLILHHRVGDEGVIECLDAATGEWFWRTKHPSYYRDAYTMGNGPRCSPIIDGDRVYALGAQGELFCLKLESGEVVWKRSINTELKAKPNFFGAGSSPLLEGELLIINAGGSEGAGIIALNKWTGKIVWSSTDDGASYSSPVCSSIGGRRYGFVLTKSHLTALAPTTGEVFWRYPFRSRNENSCNAATPVIVDDTVFISNAYRVGGALLRVSQDSPTEIWRGEKIMLNHWATSIHHDGYLYGIDGRHSNNSSLRCVELRTGETQWKHDSLGLASMVSADGKFFILSEYGDLAVSRIDPRKFEIAALTKGVLKYPCYVAPVLSQGLLYVKDEHRLLCFDIRDPHSADLRG